jgi:hypothetical protein
MPQAHVSPLFLAVALAFGTLAIAQGDDCSGALAVGNGSSGPYNNLTATTSSPGLICGFGTGDVWFSYLAGANGTLTVDLCGATFDTMIEIFDGASGCGSLTSLGCNDDSACGLESAMSVPVSGGTSYYIRVGGYAGDVGSFPLNISGPPPAGQGLATVVAYGTGCASAPDTCFYEDFPSGTHDLGGTTMSLLRAGGTYIAAPGAATYVAPSVNATSLPIGDDDQITVTLSTAMPVGRNDSTSSLTVCSNGFVSTGLGNGTDYFPDVTALLNNPKTGWYNWHDYNPSTPGSGQIKFEEQNGIAYITWDDVWDFGATAGPGSTFQLQFELANGTVHFAWQSMSAAGNDHLVGFSEGGVTADPGSTDISLALPATFTAAIFKVSPISLAATGRPLMGTSISLNTGNLNPSVPFGVVALGFNNPATDLTNLGMAGCTQYTDNLALLLFLPLGASTVSTPYSVPGAAYALGLHLLAQSIVYDPAAGLTTLGALSSNGINLGIGNF